VAQQFTGRAGKYVPIAETVKSFARLLNGEVDHIPESYFLLQGGIDDVIQAYDQAQK
jgi:F-type H+/Na+-transporting ATPase subunit beta